MKFKIYRKELFLYFNALLITLLLLAYLMYSNGFVYNLPRIYALDAIFVQATIKNIIETGWFSHSQFLAAPFTFSLVDFPMSEALNFLLIKLLALFSHNPIIVMHNFFFLTYFLITLSGLYALRKLGLNKAFALIGSILFSFLYYHLMRAESHLWLSAYYTVPIYVLFIMSIFNSISSPSNQSSWSLFLNYFFYGVILALCASGGIYYAFFACYFLLAAGVLTSLDKKNWKPLLKSVALVLFISSVVIVNIWPTIAYHSKNGPNLQVAQRHFLESETYGLKISHMLLGPEGYQVPQLKSLKRQYDQLTYNEGVASALGLVGSIGFIFLLGILLLRRNFFSTNVLFDLSRLNVLGVLLGTVGGFGSLFALLISPQIRCYNRISIFIAFFSISAFFLVLQDALKKFSLKIKELFFYLIAFFVFLLSVMIDIRNVHFPDYPAIKKAVNNDKTFVEAIEKQVPPHSRIFQLPVVPYPENPPVHNMTDYQLLRGYLHSKFLHWSYGAMRGRGSFEWQERVAQMPTKDMLNQLSYAGFAGIYLNREGYPDKGSAVEKSLSSLLQKEPLVSQDKKLIFYDLTQYAQQLRDSLSEKLWKEQKKKTLKVENLRLIWKEGWHHQEEQDQSTWRWSDRKSKLDIINTAAVSIKIKLQGQIKTNYPEDAYLWISGDLLKEGIKLNNEGVWLNREIMVPPGIHFIKFKTNAKQVVSPGDIRSMFFRVVNFRLEQQNQ